MAFRMKELTENVRVGRPSCGGLNVEVWQVPRGWESGAQIGPMEEITIPEEAIDEIFQYLQ